MLIARSRRSQHTASRVTRQNTGVSRPLHQRDLVVGEAVRLVHQRIESGFQRGQAIGRVLGGIEALPGQLGDLLAQRVGRS